MPQNDQNIKWLEGELNRWVSEGIIDGGRAEAIRRLYPERPASRPWAILVFSGLGAGIIGLGIILLFAYNWHLIPKFGKLGIVFGSLMIAHAVGITLFFYTERFRAFGEAAAVLGTMLFGAGIWLVAQIYHIAEHYPTAFLFWGIGAFVLAWSMPSAIQAIMAAVLFTIWAGSESAEFGRAIYLAIPAIILLWPIAHQKRSSVLLAVLVLALGISAGFVAGAISDGHLVINVLFSIAATYVAIGLLTRQSAEFPQSGLIYHFFGFVSYIVMLYMMTFSWMAKETYFHDRLNPESIACGLVPFLIALTAWLPVGRSFLPSRAGSRPDCYHYELFFIPLTLILFYASTFFPTDFKFWQVTAPANFVFLAFSLVMMARGCRGGNIWATIFGSLMLIALTLARFNDLVQSLAVRGLVFIVLGIIIFAEGFFYIRFKKKRASEVSK
jgi:uncharacterized membrane protein